MSAPGIRNANQRRKRFTMLANAMLRDAELSLKAKGLLGVMLSFPDDWTYYMGHLETQSSDGREAHQNAMKELLAAGYVKRSVAKNPETGRLSGWEYEVSDERETVGRETVGRESRLTGKPSDGKAATTKTDSTKTYQTKTDPKGAENSAKENPAPFQLPEWLSDEVWADFLGHRKAIKKPLSPVAAGRLIAELTRLREQGQDVGRVIDQSIVNGWAGVFVVKDQQRQAAQVSRGAEVNNNPFTVPVEVPPEEVNW